MDALSLGEAILDRLPYEPNDQQIQVAAALARFCCLDFTNDRDRVFLLDGYAGTGKTSLTGALVRALGAGHVMTALLAPTGRAAKVFAAYAGRPASTIHRAIYRHVLPAEAPGSFLRQNTMQDTVFIVDEASMISSDDEARDNILRDLIHFVYSSPGCRLILLGDTAQLPPVGMEVSPAMDPEVLRSYGLKVSRATLSKVARQDAGSGILLNATRLRRAQSLVGQDRVQSVPLVTEGYDDVVPVLSDELPDLLAASYAEYGPEETVLVTRSNRSASQFNQAIRNTVLGREELLTPGDLMIAAKNNYYWTRRVHGIDFVANGEMLRLSGVHATERRYGLTFADVTFELPDEPEINFQAKIILDCLTGDAPALDSSSLRRLYESIYTDPDIMPEGADHITRSRIMSRNDYWQALQVKFAYALTCHKAQGGQWRHVYVDLGYIPPDSSRLDYLRWLYTAVTRARTRLHLINLPGTE